MRKFTFLLTLLLAFVTTAMAQVTDVAQLSNNKCYTLVSADTGRGGMYALDGKVDMCGVTYNQAQECHGIARNAADPKQQFAFVQYEGKHYLYSVSEKKFVMKSGDTNALVGEAPFEFVTVEPVGASTFALKANDTHYFTASPGWCSNPSRGTCIQSTLTNQSPNDGWDDGAWFTITEAADFDPTEALAMLNPAPATPLAVESVYPDFTVRELSEIIVNFNAEIAGQFDPYSMTAMKFKKGNSVAAGVDNWTVEGNKLTVTLSQTVTEAGEYTLVIPEGLITRKSDGAAYSGELTFTLEEEPVVAPEVTEAELKLTFVRNGNDVTVNVAGLEGVTAAVVAKSHDWKDLAIANASTVLCPNVNGNTDPTITWALELNGVPANLNLKGMGLDIHALNGGGNYQDPADNVARHWNVVVAQGETEVANFNDIEISQGTEEGRTMNNNHKVHALEVEGPAATDPMTLNFTITKGSVNLGCFFGLSEITLSYAAEATPETPEVPETPALELADKYTATFDAGGLAVAGELLFDQDLDGNAKAGYAALKFTALDQTISDCVAYETTENTVVLKSVTVGDGTMSGQNKNVDIVFTVQENGSLLGDQKIWGNTQATSWVGLDLTATAFVPEASTPETPVALELVSIEPADGAQITEFNTVAFTFNKPVKLVESEDTGVILMYNGMPAGQLWGEVSEDGKTAVLSAGMVVNMEGTYTVYAMEGAFEDLDGNKSAEMTATYTLAGAADSFTYTYAAPSTEMTQSYLSYISLGFASAVAEVKTDALNVVDGNGNVVTTATIAADWFDEQAVEVVFEEEVSYTGTCSLTVPEGFITSALGTYNPEFTLTYNLEAEPVQAYFYHPEYNAVMVMDSVSNVATIKKNFTLEDMEANAWELHPVGKNQFKIANKATGLYLGACSTSVPVAGVDAANAKVYEMQKDGIYDVFKDVEGGNYNYLHVAASQSDKIVGWEAAAAASHWFVLNYVEDYEYLLANLELVDSLNQVIAKAEALKEQAQPYYKPLITSATQFTSNAKEASEGSYEALLDGKDNTFFHTEWSATTTSDAHNLQVLVPGNELTELWVKYQARNAGGAYNDRPTKMSIYGGTMAEDGTVTYETTAFANLTTADGIGEVAGEFKFTADKAYDAFKFEVHETVMSTGNTGNKWFTYGEFQMYSQTMTPADVTMNETQAAGLDEALEYAKNANPVEDAYSVLIDELNRAINKVLFPAATVESVDPACGHYTEMPGTVKLTFSADVQALEFGMVRTDFTGFRGYNLSEEDYTINGKELTVTVPAEYVTNAANMMITLGVIDANGQYVTYASDPDYLSEDCVFLMYTADMKSNIFMMSAVDPEEGEVETLEVINMTFGEGNTYVGGFDTTKEVVVLNANDEVVTKATMEVVKESEVDPDTNETYSWPTSTVKFTLAAPVTEAGEYTLVVPEGTVYNEGFYEDAADLGVSWGAIYNPEVRVAYTVAGVVEEYPINFDKDQDATRTDRVLSTVSLAVEGEAAQELTVANTRKAYNDMTAGEVKFVCAPGATLTPAFNYSGVWMHGYVYVDFGQDGDFSFDATTNDQTGKDLVSYSFYGVDSENYGYNSAKEYISGDGRSTLVCPAFTAPETPGEYRVRFKVDWNNVDAGGCVDPNNHILNNGGYIVDATLVVDEATAINGVSIENLNDVYTLDGRKVAVKAGQKLNKGLYIVGGKKVFVK